MKSNFDEFTSSHSCYSYLYWFYNIDMYSRWFYTTDSAVPVNWMYYVDIQKWYENYDSLTLYFSGVGEMVTGDNEGNPECTVDSSGTYTCECDLSGVDVSETGCLDAMTEEPSIYISIELHGSCSGCCGGWKWLCYLLNFKIQIILKLK